MDSFILIHATIGFKRQKVPFPVPIKPKHKSLLSDAIRTDNKVLVGPVEEAEELEE